MAIKNPDRRKAAWVNVSVFLFVLSAATVINLVAGNSRRVSGAEQRTLTDFPTLSRRTLFSGSFARQFEAWVDDHVPFRDAIIEASAHIKELRSLSSSDGARIVSVRASDTPVLGREERRERAARDARDSQGGAATDASTDAAPRADAGPGNIELGPRREPLGDRDDGENPTEATEGDETVRGAREPGAETAAAAEAAAVAETAAVGTAAGTAAATESDTAAEAPAVEAPGGAQAAEEIIREYLVLADRGVEIPAYNRASTSYFAATVRTAAAKIRSIRPESDRPVVLFALVPSCIAFLDLDRYEGIGADLETVIETAYDGVGADVVTLDLVTALEPHADEYIYFRTDHHWTARGAYYGYRALMSALDVTPVPLERYETTRVEGFVGSVYYQTLVGRLKRRPDTVEIYLPFVKHSYRTYWRPEGVTKPLIDFSYETDQNKYQIFISSDSPRAVVRCPESPDRAVAVIKDSYGNALIPFLLPHYRTIHVIDPRYYEGDLIEYLGMHPVDHVLFINSYALIGDAWGYARNLARIVGAEGPSRGE